MWSGERLTKVQTTPRPDHLWPEVWSKIWKAAQNREKQERKTQMFESRISAGATEDLLRWEKHHAKTVVLSYDMQGHAQKCVDRYCELTNKRKSNCTTFQVLAWTIINSRRRT